MRAWRDVAASIEKVRSNTAVEVVRWLLRSTRFKRNATRPRIRPRRFFDTGHSCRLNRNESIRPLSFHFCTSPRRLSSRLHANLGKARVPCLSSIPPRQVFVRPANATERICSNFHSLRRAGLWLLLERFASFRKVEYLGLPEPRLKLKGIKLGVL